MNRRTPSPIFCSCRPVIFRLARRCPVSQPGDPTFPAVCDDLGPDDFFEDESEEHEPDDDFDASDEREPTPAERIFYALGQLYRLYRHGALNVRPIDFDVWDLAG